MKQMKNLQEGVKIVDINEFEDQYQGQQRIRGINKVNILTLFYILNATLLILHEIESGYEREWEILNLPGKITSFLILHVPIIFILFYGLLEVDQLSNIGFIMGLITGLGGIIPFLVHKIIIKREESFNLLISNIIIYSNILTGITLVIYSLYFLI